MKRPAAFTLVELLVVITIIVVLLAMLAPVLDKAVYQAELAVCAANQHAVVAGAIAYAAGERRFYPFRGVLSDRGGSMRPPELRSRWSQRYDDRPRLSAAIGGTLKPFSDPLSPKVDLGKDLSATGENLTISSNYLLWFGMYYDVAIGGGKGMYKLGDRLEFRDTSRGIVEMQKFNILISEWDQLWPTGSGQIVLNPHPDKREVLTPYKVDYDSWIESGWYASTTWKRGPVDANSGVDDGSVRRTNDVEWNDDRMARVPYDAFGTGWQPNDSGLWYNLFASH